MRAILLLAALFLSACAGGPSSPPTAAEVPAAERIPANELQKIAKAHGDLALVYYQGGNMAVALQEARIALMADPNYAPAHNVMGLVHLYLGEGLQAKESFERAVRLAPQDSDIANHYGWFLCTSGQEKEAFQYFLVAVKNPLYKTPTRPYTNAGLCALRLKDDKAAEEYFQRAAMADGANSQAIFHLADIAFRRGDFFKAKNFLGEVMRLSEPNSESLWLAVRIERKLGDRQAEAGYSAQLRRKFAGTPEHQALMQGKFE